MIAMINMMSTKAEDVLFPIKTTQRSSLGITDNECLNVLCLSIINAVFNIANLKVKDLKMCFYRRKV